MENILIRFLRNPRKIGLDYFFQGDKCCPVPTSIPRNVRYSGELWIDDKGETNFKFHIMGGNFLSAREALVKFIECLQQRLIEEEKCPYYEQQT